MYQCTARDLQEYITGSRDTTLKILRNAGYITKDEYYHLSENLNVGLDTHSDRFTIGASLNDPYPDNFKPRE